MNSIFKRSQEIREALGKQIHIPVTIKASLESYEGLMEDKERKFKDRLVSQIWWHIPTILTSVKQRLGIAVSPKLT